MIIGRLIAIPVSLFAVASLAFWLIRLSGANAAATVAGEYADAEAIARTEAELGLDRNLWEQYTGFLGDLLTGDLGTSFFTRRPVSEEIMNRIPLDLFLGVLALVLAVVLGVTLGAVAAYYRSGWPDRVSSTSVSFLQSLPDFVIALVLIYVLFYLAGLLPPPVGQLDLTHPSPPERTGVVFIDVVLSGQWQTLGAATAQLLLPVASMGLSLVPAFAKVTSSTLGTVLASPQIEYARSTGLSPLRVFWSALSVTRTSLLTTIAIVIGALLGGGAVLQKIYNLDGAAAFGVDSIFKLDLPVIQGIVLVFGGLTVVAFLLIDILILLLDPRVRVSN